MSDKPHDIPVSAPRIDEFLVEKEGVIARYAEAQQTMRELRRLDEVFWYSAPDGRVVEIMSVGRDRYGFEEYCSHSKDLMKAGESPPQESAVRSLLDGGKHGKSVGAGLLALLGIAGAKSGSTEELDDKNASAMILSVRYDETKKLAVVSYGDQELDIPLKDATVDGRTVHGTPRDFMDKDPCIIIEVLDQADIEQIVKLRQRYNEARDTILEIEEDDAVFRALGVIGERVLARAGIVNPRAGEYSQSYGAQNYRDIKFMVDGRYVSLFMTCDSIKVSMANDNPGDASDYTRGAALNALLLDYSANVEPFAPGAFEKLKAKRDFSEDVIRDFERNGFRDFSVSYTNLTDALLLVARLLQAPIDANHEVLTPFFYGTIAEGALVEPHISVSSPDTLTADFGNGPIKYSVDTAGILQEEMPDTTEV